MADDDVKNGKEVEYYSQLVGAWLNSSFEKDRALLTLSSGLLGAEFTYFVASSSPLVTTMTLTLLGTSSLSLMLCIAMTLIVHDLNKKHIEEQISSGSPKSIGWIDRVSSFAFIIGVAFALLNFSIILVGNLNKQPQQPTTTTATVSKTTSENPNTTERGISICISNNATIETPKPTANAVKKPGGKDCEKTDSAAKSCN